MPSTLTSFETCLENALHNSSDDETDDSIDEADTNDACAQWLESEPMKQHKCVACHSSTMANGSTFVAYVDSQIDRVCCGIGRAALSNSDCWDRLMAINLLAASDDFVDQCNAINAAKRLVQTTELTSIWHTRLALTFRHYEKYSTEFIEENIDPAPPLQLCEAGWCVKGSTLRSLVEGIVGLLTCLQFNARARATK